jgi:hypothetical protein
MNTFSFIHGPKDTQAGPENKYHKGKRKGCLEGKIPFLENYQKKYDKNAKVKRDLLYGRCMREDIKKYKYPDQYRNGSN